MQFMTLFRQTHYNVINSIYTDILGLYYRERIMLQKFIIKSGSDFVMSNIYTRTVGMVPT